MELSPSVDIPVTVNTVWTGPAGFMTTNTAQPVMGSTTTYISTAIVNSLGRDQSGDYTCTATVSSMSSNTANSTVLSSSNTSRVTVGKDKYSCGVFHNHASIILHAYHGITPGVYLSLKGNVYPNNSNITVNEIGAAGMTLNEGLQCVTDRRPCCSTPPNRAGEWYFPGDGGVVPTLLGATTFYRNRGDDGTVNLNRYKNATDQMIPTGRYCCVVPDATGVLQWTCAIIGELINPRRMRERGLQ